MVDVAEKKTQKKKKKENTQNVETSKETDVLRNFKKSRFLKSNHRF